MAINKKLIHFNRKDKFEEELANGNILPTSIVYIKDSKEIWTHGEYYCNLEDYFTKEETLSYMNDKVDKESGKGLSTNDYTSEEKEKLNNYPNIVSISNSDYSSLSVKDPNTLYLVW